MFGQPRRRIVARRGRYQVRLPAEERALMRGLLGDLRALLSLAPEDPRVRRLYPEAYADDPEKQGEYRRLTLEQLQSGRLAAVDVLEATVDAEELTAEQITAWMHAVNALRLVLGTLLDVREDDQPFNLERDHPDAPTMALYGYLGVLLEELVEAQLGEL
jgi:Domain of unknown function (DUF2017)